MDAFPRPPDWVRERLAEGLVIPAHPLALTPNRRLDERRQRALSRYYHTAGAGGIAVGVHTTQFAIREPQHGLYRPVLELAAETFQRADDVSGRRTIRIAGICGATRQAVEEARCARELGYHSGLLSLAALRQATDDELLAHCRAAAAEIPLFGFYLQPAVGGRILPYSFWARFAQIPNVVGIKIAPFNRYQTLEVIRGVAAAGRAAEIALYTGNDDQIVVDLLTEFVVPGEVGETRARMVGGLLGQWAVWTRTAVELHRRCVEEFSGESISSSLLTLAAQLTDANAAIFDAANHFHGCIPGIHEILRRQGLLSGVECLDPRERLSPGQAEELDRICRAYPHLSDDSFVQAGLDNWLR